MKSFSSSILSVNKKSNQTPITLESFKNNNFSYQNIHEAEIAIADEKEICSRDFYISLIDVIKGKASNYDKAYDAVFNYYNTVSTILKGMLSTCNYGSNPDNISLERELYDAVTSVKRENRDGVIKFVGIAKAPFIPDCTTILVPLRAYCNNIISNIKKNDYETPGNDLSVDICKFYGKAIGIGELNTVDEFLNTYEKNFEFKTVEVLPSTAENMMYSVMEIGNVYMSPNDLDSYGLCDVTINMLKTVSGNFKDPNLLNSIVMGLCSGLETYTKLIAGIKNINDNIKKNILIKNIEAVKGSNIHEAMEMFGDEINSSDMFADLTDFQPSMFRDISLDAETEFSVAEKDIVRHAMAMEATMIAEGRYEDLPLIEGAVMEKTKDAVSNLLDAIREMMSTFLTNIQNNAKKETAFLDANKTVILNNPVDPNTKLTLYGRVPEGYQRLKKPFKIPVLRFDELKEDLSKDGVDPEKEFFEKHLKETVGQDFKRSDNKSLADDLKYYWGFKDGNKYTNYTVNDFPNIQEMYTWLHDTVNVANNLNIQAKNVDRTYNEYKRGKKSSESNAAAQKADNGNQQQKVGESVYYSYIYQKYMPISEMDLEAGKDQDDKAKENASNNNQSQPSTQQKDNNTNGEQKSGESEDKKITRNMTTYCKVCRQVISARATAFAYIHKEFMDMCRFIVKNHGGDKTKKADTQPAQQAATTTNKPQQ